MEDISYIALPSGTTTKISFPIGETFFTLGILIQHEETSYTITDLDPDTLYRFFIQAVSVDRRGSPYSDFPRGTEIVTLPPGIIIQGSSQKKIEEGWWFLDQSILFNFCGFNTFF